LENMGAVWDENPTKTTNFLIVGEWWGSKISKAQKYWIEILKWLDELQKMFPILNWKFQSMSQLQPLQKWLFD
jgi:hypothetical protein